MLFLSLLVAVGPAHAKSCKKIVEVKEDPFDGRIELVGIPLDKAGYTALGTMLKDGTYTFQVLTVEPGVVRRVSPAGEPAKLMVGGAVFELVTRAETLPVAGSGYGGPFTQWLLLYDLTPSQAQEMSSQPVTAVKATVGGADHAFDIERKAGEALRAAIACLGAT